MPIPIFPPLEWFDDPEFTEGHPHLDVTADGRFRAHLIVRHPDNSLVKGIEPGPSPTGYSGFHRHTIAVTQGDEGCNLTVGLVHMLDGLAVACVRAGDDQHGLWLAGVLMPDVDRATHEMLMARRLRLSGEWQHGELINVAVISYQDLPGFRWPPLDQPR